ncbi:MAG: response regulator transcription factor [Coriobacteriaceae bacterium]|jgi:DNA-binding response OmpR family regulator|nr:response regulator transcription factor [Coriobacteriaceae bacterium]
MKVLLIDDDKSMHVLLERILVSEGYEFIGSLTGKKGLEFVEAEKPDLVLLDVMLPEINGFDLCRHIREEGRRVPIIMVSAKGDIVDKSIGFKAGCDDYVVKPFNADELLLRIEANIRRHKDDLSFIKAVNKGGSIKTGDLEVFFDHYEAYLRGKKIDLTSKEFETLALLAANPGKVFTRNQIHEHIWGETSKVAEDSITVFVRRIREKIEDNPSQPRYLLTVWRVGYKFVERL